MIWPELLLRVNRGDQNWSHSPDLESLSLSGMSCMSPNCDTIAPEDFVLLHITKDQLKDKYNLLAFQDHVRAHPQLR